MIDAIRRAAKGEILFDHAQRARAANWKEEVTEKLGHLSPQERKVLEQLVQGLDNKAISQALDISAKTTA